MGGHSDVAFRRAARLGDGWLGVWVSARRFAGAVEEMEAAAEEAGRSGVQWHNALNVWCGVGDSARSARSHVAPKMQDFYQTPYEAFEKWSPAGEAKAVAEFLAPYVEAGCHTFNRITCGESWEAEVEGAAEVASLLRG